jgi:hypothetical protein
MNVLMFNATPLLPHPVVQYLSVHLGWGLVLAALVLWAARRWAGMSRTGPAVLGAIAFGSCFLPGALSPSFWLGLAFQAPSLCTALICATLLREQLRKEAAPPTAPVLGVMPVIVVGVVLGWLLLLDTLAILPVQLYALGFHPVTSGLLLLLGLLPCNVHGAAAWRNAWVRVLPAAVVLFVLSRWPSGNAWDAVLDPWLWLTLNVSALLAFWKRAG